jgi:hypothetical protein
MGHTVLNINNSHGCHVISHPIKLTRNYTGLWGISKINPFQSNFSATRILPSSYLFWAGKRLVDYLSVLHEEKRRTGSDSGAGEQTLQKKCRTSSDIKAEQENHNVGRRPTLDRKGLIPHTIAEPSSRGASGGAYTTISYVLHVFRTDNTKYK